MRDGCKDKKRILHVLDKISIESGVSTAVMNYYNMLDHGSMTFDFMLNEDVDAGTRARIEGNGSKIYIMPGLKAANLFKYLKALKQFYRESGHRIIHGHVANSAVFYLGAARKKIPFRILHSHSTKAADVWWKRIRNWALTRLIKIAANRYMACSEDAARFLFGKKHSAVIMDNAIDAGKFQFDKEKREAVRRSLKLEGKLVIGHIGRFTPLKNHDFLLEAFKEAHGRDSSTALLLIGGGELYGRAVQKAKKLGLGKAAIFLGPKENVGDYLSAMDVFALPSQFEGLGLVGVEAQASGLKVIASDAVPRIIDATGNVVFLRLDKSLWVQELLSGATDWDRAEQGRKIKGGRFDIETQAGKLCEYYGKLLEQEKTCLRTKPY